MYFIAFFSRVHYTTISQAQTRSLTTSWLVPVVRSRSHILSFTSCPLSPLTMFYSSCHVRYTQYLQLFLLIGIQYDSVLAENRFNKHFTFGCNKFLTSLLNSTKMSRTEIIIHWKCVYVWPGTFTSHHHSHSSHGQFLYMLIRRLTFSVYKLLFMHAQHGTIEAFSNALYVYNIFYGRTLEITRSW